MISSNVFDGINLLDRAADASVKRQTVLANNIANADTPTYKRKDIDFSKTLMREMIRLSEKKNVETQTRYHPREYGVEYGMKYGSLPNSYKVYSGEDVSDFKPVDGTNVGVIASKIDTEALRPKIYTEYRGLSYRIDKNNVDPDTENVEIASEQIKYQVLTQSISHEFSQLKAVMSR